MPGRLARGFAIPLQQIQRFPGESGGIDVFAVFKRRLECLAKRRAGGIIEVEQGALTPRVEHKQSAVGVAPDSPLAGIDFQVSFCLRNHRVAQQLAKQVIAPGFSRRQRGFSGARLMRLQRRSVIPGPGGGIEGQRRLVANSDDDRRGTSGELLQERVVEFIHHRVAVQHIQHRITGGRRRFIRHRGPHPVMAFAIGRVVLALGKMVES